MMWNFNQFASNSAVIEEGGRKITYSELCVASDTLATQIKKRCLVFCLCGNTIGSLIGYVTFLRNRIVPLLLESTLNKELLLHLINIYKPEYLWIPNYMFELLGTYRKMYTEYDYVLVKTNFDTEYHLFTELALLLTTSGSTGSPKLVRQSYQNIEANTKSIVEYLELDESERPITTLPMSYTFGLSIINTHLYSGATILMTNRSLMEKEFWQFFKEQEATSFGGVPYHFEMLDKLKFFRMELPTLRTFTQAGGKLLPELHKKFAEFARDNDKHFIVMYGQTEATARMSYLPFEKSLEKYGSMGIAIPGGKFSLIDVDGNIIGESDIVGELVYCGDNVTLGYAECGEDLIKGDVRNSKLITGDMAKRDDDGYYYIVGRKKRFLKIFGNRVNLDECERMIKAKFIDIDCACVGLDDNMYIFITSNRESIKEEVKKYLRDITGLNKVAFSVKYVGKIPKNESGKTLYIKLEQFYD